MPNEQEGMNDCELVEVTEESLLNFSLFLIILTITQIVKGGWYMKCLTLLL